MTGYDFIGDIHGQAAELETLLETLNYQPDSQSAAWTHPQGRRLFFLGDFIDRGPRNIDVVLLVRTLCESGIADSIMGNHELNALAFHTRKKDGDPIRPNSTRNRQQHGAFLCEVEDQDSLLRECLDFFWTLPLVYDGPDFRAVHACWSEPELNVLRTATNGSFKLNQHQLEEAFAKGSDLFRATECVAKGKEVNLPNGVHFNDKDGYPRYNARIRWWAQAAENLSDVAMSVPADELDKLANVEVNASLFEPYPAEAPPVFFGHYWLSGTPEPVAPNAACLDYSVARPGGKLCAYRWDGERTLDRNKYVAVARAATPG